MRLMQNSLKNQKVAKSFWLLLLYKVNMTHREDNKSLREVLEVLIEQHGLDGMARAMEIIFNLR